MIYPLARIEFTQKFGENPSIYKQFGMAGHNGIDFRTAFLSNRYSGKVECVAALDGIIMETGDEGKKGYGKFVRLQHDNGAQTIYGHFSQILVDAHQAIHAGDKIGITGNTGFSTGSHLHFGYRPEGWQANYSNGFKGYVDPMPYLTGKKQEKKEVLDPEFAKKWSGWLIIVPELGGQVWYVSPKTLKRYKLEGGVKSADAALLGRDGVWIGMTYSDLTKIPEA